mgnify:CR=1 FL=1
MSRGKKSLKNYCLGVVLRRLLAERNFSLTQLACNTDMPVSTLHDWLYGNVPANPEDVQKVAAYFKLTRDDLEFGTSNDRAQQEEIARLRDENERLEVELEKNQLNILSYIEKISELSEGKAG